MMRITRERAVAVTGAVVAAAAVALVVTGTPSRGTAATPVTGDTITVAGSGTVQGAPDTLTGTLRVHARRSSVQSALDASSRGTRAVIASLRQHGVAARDIRTADLSLDQAYGSHGAVVGYDSSESLTVRIHPLQRVGEVLTAATTAAGNSVSLDGLSFDITHDRQLLAAARDAAFADAKAAAMQDASLAGRRLGRVVTIKEALADAPAGGGLKTFDRASALASIPIRPGQQPEQVRVSVVWALS